MESIVCLNSLKEQLMAEVEFVKGPIKIKRRLLDLGFTKGSSVKIINASANKGSFLIELRGYIVALRNNAVSLISVKVKQ